MREGFETNFAKQTSRDSFISEALTALQASLAVKIQCEQSVSTKQDFGCIQIMTVRISLLERAHYLLS